MIKPANGNCHGWLFLYVVILIVTSAGMAWGQAQPHNCPTLREGKFQIDDTVNGGEWIVTRKAGVQHEENEQLGVAVEYLVEWIDDCTFRLMPYQILRNDARLELGGDTKFIVEIVEIEGDTFLQETTVWKTGQYISTIVKVVR